MITYNTNPGCFSFFTAWTQIIFRTKGSIVVSIFPQICLAVGVSVVACIFEPDISSKGHVILGVPLAFLLVFKSQLSYNQYWEGRGHAGELVRASRSLIIQSLSYIRSDTEGDRPMPKQDRSGDGEKNWAREDKEIMCLLVKLFYLLVLEFCRNAGPGREDASNPKMKLMNAKIAALMQDPTLNTLFANMRQKTAQDSLEIAKAKTSMPGTEDTEDTGSRIAMKKNFSVASMMERVKSQPWVAETGGKRATYNRGRPLLCLQWMMEVLSRATDEGRLGPMRMHAMDANINSMMRAFNGMSKIDEMLFPFPYAQLVKVFEFIFCYTLPFALYSELEWYTPPVAALMVIGFYGIDGVGEILEDPFGTNPNDLNMDAMGDGLMTDIDMFLHEDCEFKPRNVLGEMSAIEVPTSDL